MSNKEKTVSTFENFAKSATVLGFIVDFIAIMSILISFSLGEETPSFITPSLALGILVLATFSYFGWLHSYWLENQEKYSSRFTFFVFGDLILNFRSPKHLFPLVALIVAFFLISGSGFDEEKLTPLSFITVCGGTGLFIAIISLLVVKNEEIKNHSANLSRLQPRNFKTKVNENWEFWENRIELELANSLWVSEHAFVDLLVTEEVPKNGIEYVLAKYASMHRDKTEFGILFLSKDNSMVIDNVLKNLEYLKKQDKYF